MDCRGNLSCFYQRKTDVSNLTCDEKAQTGVERTTGTPGCVRFGKGIFQVDEAE